jgi:hypothetical protein
MAESTSTTLRPELNSQLRLLQLPVYQTLPLLVLVVTSPSVIPATEVAPTVTITGTSHEPGLRLLPWFMVRSLI